MAIGVFLCWAQNGRRVIKYGKHISLHQCRNVLLLQSYMEEHLRNRDRLDADWEEVNTYESEEAVPCESAKRPENVHKNREGCPIPCEFPPLLSPHWANLFGCLNNCNFFKTRETKLHILYGNNPVFSFKFYYPAFVNKLDLSIIYPPVLSKPMPQTLCKFLKDIHMIRSL